MVYFCISLPQNLTRFQAQSVEILNEEFGGEFDYLFYAEHCFDGVRAFALALNKTLQGNCSYYNCIFEELV